MFYLGWGSPWPSPFLIKLLLFDIIYKSIVQADLDYHCLKAMDLGSSGIYGFHTLVSHELYSTERCL